MSNPTEHEEIFRMQIAAFAARDVEQLLALYPDDCVLQDMADPDNPVCTKATVGEWLTGYFATLDEIDVLVGTIATGEDSVFGEIEVSANFVDAPFSPESPRRIRVHYCVVDVIRDGKIARERFYWDRACLERQLNGPELPDTVVRPA